MSKATDNAVLAIEREGGPNGDRYVDLRMDFVFTDPTDVDAAEEVLFSVGAPWDRVAKAFVEREAESGAVVRIHEGQRRAVEWFATWLDAHRGRRVSPPPPPPNLDDFELDTDPEHVYSALFAGGRRGGKTWIATALAVAYACAFPGAIVWLVSPNEKKHDEFRRYVTGCVAAEWLDAENADGWTLCNGSRLMLKGAHVAEGLKEGECNFCVMNEGQMMKRRNFTVARGSIVDRSGLVLVCANPPVESGDQQWVTDFAADAAAGRRAAVFIEFNPLLNPHIDRTALLAMRLDLDERTFAIEVLGQFRGPKDAVAYNWIRLENERAAPRLYGGMRANDCTAELCSLLEEGDDIRHIVGLDVQRFPHIGGPVYQFFGEPHPDRVHAWIVDEVVLEGGDEVDFCSGLRERGYDPATTLIVCDASGRYQHSRRRSLDAPPPDWQGKGSFDIIRTEGYWRIVPPMRHKKTNPEIVDRMRAFTSMICSGFGNRRLFADAKAAPKTCHAIRDWRTKHGTPHRTQHEAHLGDAASYPIVRLFPRKLRSDKTGQVDPIAARVDALPVPGMDHALRILPPRSGPAPRARRADRFRGM